MNDLSFFSDFLLECYLASSDEIKNGLLELSNRIRNGTANEKDLEATLQFVLAAKAAAEGKGEKRMQPYGEVYNRIRLKWEKDHPKS